MILKTYQKFIKKIDKNKKIAILGSDYIALEFAKQIELSRDDLKITFLITHNPNPNITDYKIHHPHELKLLQDNFDLIIVADYSYITRLKILFKLLEINNYIIPSPKMYLDAFLEKVSNTSKLLATNKDKKLYKLLAKARVTKDHSKVKSSGYSGHYLDFINKDIITTAFDIGAYDAYNSLVFKANFKNCNQIYSFEPIYEECKNDLLVPFIEEDNKIKIIKKAIWNKSGKSNFKEIPNERYKSGLVDVSSMKSHLERVQSLETISIDEFIEQEKIKKLDFVKMDIENAELAAIEGGLSSIIKHRPQLAISIYHSGEQYTDILIKLNESLTDYVYKIGHYDNKSVSETVLYAIPKEKLK